MAFFDGLGKKITDTVDVVGKKTNEVVEIQKLRGQISSLEKNMDRSYEKLGRLVFEKYQNGEVLTEEERAICEEITGNAVLIDEYENEIAEIKGLKKCPGCGAPAMNDAVYCPKCGTKLEDIKVDAEVVDAEEYREPEACCETEGCKEPEACCEAEECGDGAKTVKEEA